MTKKSFAAMAMLALGAVSAFSAAPTDASIERQIAQIEQAPASERWKKMNAFKERLATMAPAERTQIIETLQQRFAGTEAMTTSMTTLPAMEQVIDQHQATQILHMETMEKMGQQQGVDQYIQNHPDLISGYVELPSVPQPSVPDSQTGVTTPSVPTTTVPTVQNDQPAPTTPVLPFGTGN